MYLFQRSTDRGTDRSHIDPSGTGSTSGIKHACFHVSVLDIKHPRIKICLTSWVGMSDFYPICHSWAQLLQNNKSMHRPGLQCGTHCEMMSNVHQQPIYGNIAEQWTRKFFQVNGEYWGGQMETWWLICLIDLILSAISLQTQCQRYTFWFCMGYAFTSYMSCPPGDGAVWT